MTGPAGRRTHDRKTIGGVRTGQAPGAGAGLGPLVRHRTGGLPGLPDEHGRSPVLPAGLAAADRPRLRDRRGSLWGVMYILPLEGALRYRLEGALAAVGISLVSEVGREAYLASSFSGYQFQLSNVAFTVGIQAVIALVAGFMASSMAREAENTAEQARRFQEAARRESLARRELSAFNTAI